MALGGVYETGTITIAVDKITVTGVGTLWGPIAEVGDWILCNGQVGLVEVVSDDTHLILQSDWQGTLPSAAAYVLIKMSWLRYDPSLTQAKLRQLLADIDAQGAFLFTSVAPSDPALGQDGQWALQTNVTPWKLWYKTGGVWVQQATPAGLTWKGAWSAATNYIRTDAVARLGSSYVADTNNVNKPPESNPVDWLLLAQAGAGGATGPIGPPGMVWRGTWNSGTAYVVNDAVQYNGASYIAVVNNTNSAPPSANWNLIAQAGSVALANSSVEPIHLNSDTGAEQLAFRDRLNYVSRAGDTMTGNLQIQNATPLFTLNSAAGAGGVPQIYGLKNGLARWAMYLGQNSAEPGGNAGGDFVMLRFNDAGSFIDSPFYIQRTNAQANFSGNLLCAGVGTFGSTQIGNGASSGLYGDGSILAIRTFGVGAPIYFQEAGGSALFGYWTRGLLTSYTPVVIGSGAPVAGNLNVKITSDVNVIFTSSGTAARMASVNDANNTYQPLTIDASITYLGSGGPVLVGGVYNGDLFTVNGIIDSLGYRIRQGETGLRGFSTFNFYWNGNLEAWVDATFVGNVAFTSDYRGKKDIAELPRTWDAVKALRPIKYTRKDFTPPGDGKDEPRDPKKPPLIPGDDIERWGFIAHELQETLLPSAATGTKDAPNTVQSPDMLSVIAALTKALQEAMQRIERLESALKIS